MRKLTVDPGDGKKEVLLQLVKEPVADVPVDFKKPTDFAGASMVLPNEGTFSSSVV